MTGTRQSMEYKATCWSFGLHVRCAPGFAFDNATPFLSALRLIPSIALSCLSDYYVATHFILIHCGVRVHMSVLIGVHVTPFLVALRLIP